jgi:dienelactone hydrolase
MRDAQGAPHLLFTRICHPRGTVPAPVVVINHGTPARADDRPTRQPTRCDGEAARWFLTRGYMVVAGMRRGHGPTGGRLAETSGGCDAAAFVRSARESARDLDALVSYAAGLPGARPGRMLMVGQSTGGWATLGYNSVHHPRVAAMVNMAGGRGGHYQLIPHNNCRPDQLVLAAGILGQTATTPMLWVYTDNDTFFGPHLAGAMHDAFTRAGGVAELVRLPPFGEDGHGLFFARSGSAIWGPLLERYLARLAVATAP